MSMFHRRHRPPPPVHVIRIEELEFLMASIADLTAAVNALVTVEQEVVVALGAAVPTGTVLSADDQAALDSAVATVQSVAQTLTAALPPAAPTPPAEGGSTAADNPSA
jgi:N-methylhydantoinase B/oxoprolinase/acetone carboxylase alpha subunit